jgi:hypothetical protein
MSAEGLRKYLEEFPEDIAALDEAAQLFDELGKLDSFKIEYKPSTLIKWFAESNTETLRDRISGFRYIEMESEGPYEPISQMTKYGSVIPDGWTGDDADEFQEYIEGAGGVDTYLRDLRLMAQSSLNALEDAVDQLDASCAELLNFCQEHVTGFSGKYNEFKTFLETAGISLGAGVVGGTATILAELVYYGAVTRPEVLIAILVAVFTMVLTLVVLAFSIQGKWRNLEADIMTKLNANQLIADTAAAGPEGHGPLDFV